MSFYQSSLIMLETIVSFGNKYILVFSTITLILFTITSSRYILLYQIPWLKTQQSHNKIKINDWPTFEPKFRKNNNRPVKHANSYLSRYILLKRRKLEWNIFTTYKNFSYYSSFPLQQFISNLLILHKNMPLIIL